MTRRCSVMRMPLAAQTASMSLGFGAVTCVLQEHDTKILGPGGPTWVVPVLGNVLVLAPERGNRVQMNAYRIARSALQVATKHKSSGGGSWSVSIIAFPSSNLAEAHTSI